MASRFESLLRKSPLPKEERRRSLQGVVVTGLGKLTGTPLSASRRLRGNILIECGAAMRHQKIPSVGGGEGLRSLHRSARLGFVPAFKNPPEVPLVQGGTLFSSNVAPQRGRKSCLENKLPYSVEEGMPWPTATAGVVGVPCSSATDRTTATTARSTGFLPAFRPP
jgi:hypothetical protein